MKLSAAVLAGGQSSRMGRDKALIEIGGRALVLLVVDRLRTISDDVFVVAKRSELLDLRVVTDERPQQTPLAGIASAIRAAEHPLVFVCACDMPFVSPAVVRLLADRAEDVDAVVPVHNDRPEPSHVVWSSGAAATIHSALDAGELAVHRVFDRLRVRWVEERDWRTIDPDARSFVNLNTPDDLLAQPMTS